MATRMALQSDEQIMIRDLVREFAAAEIAPLAPRIDAEGRVPEELWPKLAALNLFGLTCPADAGGAGVDAVSYAIAIEEVARVCASTAFILVTHNSLGVAPVVAAGSEAQRRRWLGPLASGALRAAFALAEQEAGGNASALRANAVRDGNKWTITGDKVHVACAGQADVFLIAARIEAAAAPANVGVFLIEKTAPGLVVGPVTPTLGLRGAELGSLQLRAVTVDDEHLLGAPGEGLAILERALAGARIALGALAVGIAQGAFERALRYSCDRPQFGRRIAEHQSVQERLADAAVETHAARLTVYDAAQQMETGGSATRAAAMARLFATAVATRVADHAIQLHGGYGYVSEYHVERAYRDAQTCEAVYGSNDVQRIVIGRELLREVDAGWNLLH